MVDPFVKRGNSSGAARLLWPSMWPSTALRNPENISDLLGERRRGRALRTPTTPRPASAFALAMTPTVRLSLNYCTNFVFPVGSLFRLRVSHHLDHATFPALAASNAACGFPRTALTCLLRLKAYGTYPAGTAFSAGRTTR